LRAKTEFLLRWTSKRFKIGEARRGGGVFLKSKFEKSKIVKNSLQV
jgi:hypothetical protein